MHPVEQDDHRPDRTRRHLVLLSALVGVVVLDAFLNLVVLGWGSEEFWRYKRYSLIGLHLWTYPFVLAVSGTVAWWPWQPFVWFAAWATAGATWTYGRGIRKVPLGLYTLLMALIVSGFAATQWWTVGA